MNASSVTSLTINKGTCYAVFAYDIGWSINLEDVNRRITADRERSRLRHKTRAPQYFEYRPAPLRLMQEGGSLAVGQYQSSPTVEVMVYDFGAVTITYRFTLDGPFEGLLELSESLYENEPLLTESRKRVEQLVQAIHPSIERPKIAKEVEDYIIFSIESYSPEESSRSGQAGRRNWRRCFAASGHRSQTKKFKMPRPAAFRTESEMPRLSTGTRLCSSEKRWTTCEPCWNLPMWSSWKCGCSTNSSIRRWTRGTQRSLESRACCRSPVSHDKDTTHIAQLQVDGALLFERVTNTLKLLGDQYLARVYRLASQRFHLEAWDASILRKLETLESIYDKMSDRATTRRMEVLEWIIIVLIAVSIAVSFFPGVSGH